MTKGPIPVSPSAPAVRQAKPELTHPQYFDQGMTVGSCGPGAVEILIYDLGNRPPS